MVFTSSIYLFDTYILLPFAVLEELGFYLKLTDMKTQVNRYEDRDMKTQVNRYEDIDMKTQVNRYEDIS